MPNNRNGKVCFRNLSRPLQALLVSLVVIPTIWLIMLTSSVNDADSSVNIVRDDLNKRNSWNEKTGPLKDVGDFGFSVGLPSFMDIWHFFVQISPIIVILALVGFGIHKYRSSRRRARRTAPANSSS